MSCVIYKKGCIYVYRLDLDNWEIKMHLSCDWVIHSKQWDMENEGGATPAERKGLCHQMYIDSPCTYRAGLYNYNIIIDFMF